MKKNSKFSYLSETTKGLFSRVDTGKQPDEPFIVIPGKGEPRWILPRNFRYGYPVLNGWRPYGLLSFAVWKTFLALYRLDILSMFSDAGLIRPIFHEKTWFNCVHDGTHIPVIYVGTPGNNRKAVVMMVKKKDGALDQVVKVPIGTDAGMSIINEAKSLSAIQSIPGLGVPEILFTDPLEKVTVQSPVGGRLGGRSFNERHVDILRLIEKIDIPQKDLSFPELREDLYEEIRDLPMDETVRKTLWEHTERLDGDESLTTVVVHGDFAPWNIKFSGDGRFGLVDWEEAYTSGLPLYDVCHFFLIQCFLFKTSWSLGGMLENVHVKRYREMNGLNGNISRKLVVFYHVRHVLGLLRTCRFAGYGEYLLANLKMKRVS